MNIINQLFSKELWKKHIHTLLYIFPLGTICLIGTTILIMREIDTPSEDHMSMIFSLILGFFLSIGFSLIAHSESLRSKKYILLSTNIIAIVLIGGIYLSLDRFGGESIEFFSYFFLYGMIMISLICIGDFFLREKGEKNKNEEYAQYFTNVVWNYIMSIIVGTCLMILGSLVFFSLDELFSIRWTHSFEHWANISYILCGGLYLLTHMPETKNTSKEMNTFFHFIIQYIAPPFLIIYFIILYAYTIKVLINFGDWPNGVICWLVIGFSTFGYVYYIFSQSLRDITIIGWIRKYFPYFVIPQVGMLFYAISLRIGQYGITINRYFVVAFGIWLISISIYLIISRKKSLSYIISSLGLIAILISIGPWGVFSLSYQSQWNNLISNLTEAKILQNGIIIPLKDKDDIDTDLSVEVYSGINYLCQYRKCEGIKKLFANELTDIKKSDMINSLETTESYATPNRWDIAEHLKEKLKLYSYNPFRSDTVGYTYITFFANSEARTVPLDITGYDSLIQTISYKPDRISSQPSGGLELSAYSGTTILELSNSGTIIETIDLSEFIGKLQDLYKKDRTTNREELIYTYEGQKARIQLRLDSIQLKNPLYKAQIGNLEYEYIGNWIQGQALIDLR